MPLGPSRRRMRAALFAACLAGVVPNFAQTADAQTVLSGAEDGGGDVTETMTIAAARILARQALDQGRPDISVTIARQILSAAPDDADALLLLAAAEAQLGNGAAGAAAARRAYVLSDPGERRFEAAFLTAYALSQDDQTGRAKFWLRRASTLAPDAASRDAIAKSYRDLAARSPLSLRFTAQAGPSANVNGGSSTGTMVILGLPFTIPEALPGGVWQVGTEAHYRLTQSTQGVTEVFAIASHRGVWLSDEAEAIAPTARASDFAISQVEAGVSRRWLDASLPIAYSATLSGLGTWYGGEALSHGLRLKGRLAWTGTPDQVWSGEVSLEQSWNDLRRVRDAQVAQLTLGWQKAFAGGTSLWVTGGVRNTASDAADVANVAVLAQIGVAPSLKPMGVQSVFTLGVEGRDYVQMPGIGTDINLSAEASFVFTKVDYMGFVPKLTLSAQQTRSDFAPRDTQDLSIGLGVVSTF